MIVGLAYQTAPDRRADAQGSMLVFDAEGILGMKMDDGNAVMQLSIEAPGVVRMRLRLLGGHEMRDLGSLTGWHSAQELLGLIANTYQRETSSP